MAWWGEGSVRWTAVVCMALCSPLPSILITHKNFPSIFQAEVKKQRRENTLCSKNSSQNRSGWKGHCGSPQPPSLMGHMAQACVQTDPVLSSEGDSTTSLGHLPVHGQPTQWRSSSYWCGILCASVPARFMLSHCSAPPREPGSILWHPPFGHWQTGPRSVISWVAALQTPWPQQWERSFLCIRIFLKAESISSEMLQLFAKGSCGPARLP